MGVKRVGLTLVLAAGLAGCGAENQVQTAGQIVKGGSDETGEYIAPVNWWKPAPDHTDPAACPSGRGGGWRRPSEHRPVLGVGSGLGRSGGQPESDHRCGVGRPGPSIRSKEAR